MPPPQAPTVTGTPRLTPEAADTLFDAIVAALARADRSTALRLAVTALAGGLDEPLVLLLAAEDLDAQGRGPEALALLLQAAEIAPDEAEVWFCLGTLRLRQGSDEPGLADLQTALTLQPDMQPALRTVATASYRLGRFTEAERCYRRLVELAPQDDAALAALAAIAARQRRPAQARALAGRALALRPDSFTAAMALGRADLAESLADSARERMDHLLARPALDDDARIAALDLRADALDSLDRPAAAFADYSARNTLLQQQYGPRIAREVAEPSVAQALRLARELVAVPGSAWQATASPAGAEPRVGGGHVFLLSFPRSGTTLLEKVLASHPQVVTLEEVDHLGDVGRQWLAEAGGLGVLARLSEPQLASARQRYWQAVQHSVGGDLAGRTVLDKLPLHTLALPVIARLFPEARVLFALRDPRDVVLSGFRRRFQINPAMFELLDLAGAARYYSAVMALAERCRAVLPLPLHEVRHEAVVLAFEPTVRAVLNFMGLDWDPAVLRFAEQLPADPRTPSDLQLRRGLSTDGLAQWRRYATQMAPVLGTLAPWVQHFSYADPT